MEKAYYTPAQAGLALGIGTRMVQLRAKQNLIPHIRQGKRNRILIPVTAFHAWLDAQAAAALAAVKPNGATHASD